MKRITIAMILAAASFCGTILGAQSTTRPVDMGFPQMIKESHRNLKADFDAGPLPLAGLPVPVVVPPATHADISSSDDLPVPHMRFDPARLSAASSLQVAAASQGAEMPAGNHANPARSLSQSAPGRINAAAAVVTPKPAVASRSAHQSSQPSQVQPVSRPRDLVLAPGVQPPVPLQRSTSPTIVDVAKARTMSTSTTVSAAVPSALSSQTVGVLPSASNLSDPHSLPEYHLVQLPGQSAPPLPPQSLPVGAQDLNGIQGQIMAIKLSGRGWIYTGTGQTPAGVSYIEKSVQSDTEQFKFRLDAAGRQVLQFQRQDVASGLLDRQEAAVTIQPRNTGVSTGQMQTVSIVQPDSGQYQPQYQILEDASRTLPVSVSTQRTQMQGVPETMVSATLPVSGPLPTDAPGLFTLAVQSDQDHQSAAALALYEKLSTEWPSWDKADEVLYRTARLLESASDGKDVKRAYELYVRIQNEYPYGPWSDPSKERGRYISRTFFHP